VTNVQQWLINQAAEYTWHKNGLYLPGQEQQAVIVHVRNSLKQDNPMDKVRTFVDQQFVSGAKSVEFVIHNPAFR